MTLEEAETVTNEQTVARIQAGEDEGQGMAALYEQMKAFIHSIARKYQGCGVDLEDLEQVLPIRFETEEYETVNGFLIDQLDRIPAEDERCVVEYEGYRFTVLSVENNTIGTVKIEKLPEEC